MGMRARRWSLATAISGALALAALASAQESAESPQAAKVDWQVDVRPILAEHCFTCHGPDPDARAADVRLDTAEGLSGGGPDAPVIPGDPENSELLYRVLAEDDFERMPPPGTGEGLRAEEIATLRAWIDQGAEWEPHWAYAPFGEELEAPEPVIDDGRERTPIDTFLRRRLQAEGLDLAADAPIRDQVRRLYLDVTGLPPRPETVDQYVDPGGTFDGDWWARLVDQLLASREHAEHFALPWLDSARYADSHGFTTDGARSMWPWRDWVVSAIHEDMPFDQFTVEQLAGDLLPEATRSQRLATGFHRNTQINGEGGAKDEENRVAAVMDRVATTGAVWLGTTMACAQCHTHKFDPVTHTDYFRMFAVFNSTRTAASRRRHGCWWGIRRRRRGSAGAYEARLAEAEEAYRAAWGASSHGWVPWAPGRATGSNGPELRPSEHMGAYRVVGQNAVFSTYVLEGDAPEVDQLGALRLEVLPDGGPGRSRGRNFVLQEVRLSSRPADDPEAPWTPHPLAGARADFEQDTRAEGGGLYRAAFAVDGDPETPGWAIKPSFDVPHAAVFELQAPAQLKGRVLQLELVQEHGGNHTMGAFRVCLRGGDPDDVKPLVTPEWRNAWAALREVRGTRPRLPTSLVMEERGLPRESRRFHRGSFLDPREVVEPGVPESLDRFAGGSSKIRDRLDLARWLVHPENALVHRVTVNRWWQQVFGRGLVETENDFGLRGARPSHVELLEWLAREHVRSGFSRRAFLRMVLNSTAYRQGRSNPQAAARDPENRWLGRRIPRRLSGEALRDSMLAVARLLDQRDPGGPPVQPVQPSSGGAFTQNAKSTKPSGGSARFRRSLYTRSWRSSPFPFYQTFDAPTRDVSCTRRSRSATPLQALALANDPLVMEAAEGFGAWLIAPPGPRLSVDNGMETWVWRAWREALGRGPLPLELSRVTAHLEGVRQSDGEDAVPAALARLVFNLAEFTYRP